MKPGTFVKVPAHARHNLTNTGTDDLVFLVIYDSAEPRLSRGPGGVVVRSDCEQSLKEVPVALQGDAEILGRGILPLRPLLVEP